MAKYRNSNTILNRFFERTDQPIYLVGNDLTIQFANPALANWLRMERTALVGSKMVYGLGPLPNNDQSCLNGLCPPLELFGEQGMADETKQSFFITAWDATTVVGETHPRWRAARAIRTTDVDGEDSAVLVIGSNVDLEAPPTIDPQSLVAHQLHLALSEIRQRTQLCYQLENLVGTSPFAQRLRRQATLATGNQADLLIVGPAGSGKEFLARAVHAAGADGNKSDLIPLHCPMADQELLQSVVRELLKKQPRSWSTEKDQPRDTLLLLDVDQLPPAVQTELWGFMRLPKFMLRIIATSSADLRELSRSGNFELELAQALGTMTIELLPLAERVEDIPLLAQSLLEKRNPQRALQLAGFEKSAMQMLVEFRWPGNLDELAIVIRDASAQAQSSLLSLHDLPKKFRDQWRAQQIGSPTEVAIDLENFLESIERELLLRAVDQAKGNKTKAAKLLSMNRAKLLRRLQYFQLIAGPGLEQLPLEDSESAESELLSPEAFEEIE